MKTTRQRKIVVIALAILLIAPSTLTWAADVYVDCRNTEGPWNGSTDHPYQTIQDAIDAATTYDGDTLRVADCTYEEGIVVNKFLKIYGSGPDVTTIDATNVAGEPAAVTIEQNMEVTIHGFRIISHNSGVLFKRDSKPIISNNIINGEYGINAFQATDADIVIKSNTVDNCLVHGIKLSPQYVTDTLYAKIYNNIISSNSECGISISHTQLTSAYNDVWNNGTNYCSCSPGTGSISENPKYVDPITGNYRLQATSPCVDAGWPVKTELDPDGTRNNMGAYGGPGSADFWPDSPGAPVVTDLTVTPAAVPQGGTVTIKATGRVRPYSPGQE